MAYTVQGQILECDDLGYLLEADYRDETAEVIAVADGIALSEAHWEVIRFLRAEYQEHGTSPNFRTMLKEFQSIRPGADSKYLYDLYPMGPAKQGAKIAGLPQPFGKGGY